MEAVRLERSWPGYRTIWRWHFYAGLIAIPFILWLATTGAIYLFRPQIEAWLDRPYDHLDMTGGPASAQAQVSAALKAVPGSNLHFYQLPTTPQSAVQIIVGRGAKGIPGLCASSDRPVHSDCERRVPADDRRLPSCMANSSREIADR